MQRCGVYYQYITRKALGSTFLVRGRRNISAII